jgi:hypothetical protein
MENEKHGSVQNVGGSKSRTIGAYEESFAGDYHELSKRVGIPLSLLIGWRKDEEKNSGWLSCPVTCNEYATLVILSDRLWCNPFLLRMQLSRLTSAQQEFVVRGAGLNWVESVVLEDLLRLKVLKERRTIQFPWYQKWFEDRYPRGYQQLTLDLFQKMAKRVSDIIKSAKLDRKYQLLVESLWLENGEEIGEVQECQNKQMHSSEKQIEHSGHIVEKAELDEAEAKMRDEIKPDSAHTDREGVIQWQSFEEWARQFCFSPLIHRLNLEHKLQELNENKKKDDDNKDDPEKK